MADWVTVDDPSKLTDASGATETASAASVPKAMAKRPLKAVSAPTNADSGWVKVSDPNQLTAAEGSVFDTPQAAMERRKQQITGAGGDFSARPTLGKVAEMGIGPLLAGAASIVSPEFRVGEGVLQGGIAAGKLIGQGAAGLLTTYAQSKLSHALGEPSGDPSFGDYARSAALNIGFTGLGELIPRGLSPKGAETVASRFEGQTERSPAQIRAALLDKKVLQQSGMSDQQIEDWFTRVSKDPEELTKAANVATVARDMGDMYTKINNSVKGQFNQRFAAMPFQDRTIPSAPLATNIDGILAKAPAQARDSSVYKFLQEKRDGFSGGAGYQSFGPNVTPEENAALSRNFEIQQQQKSITLGELRQRITESYENEPRNATPAEKRMMTDYRNQLRQQFDSSMQAAGATPEQLNDIKETYRAYGDAQETLRKLDPRSDRLGTEASNALFGGMIKSPDDGVQLIRMVKEADKVHPGTFTQFKQGFISHLLSTAQERAGGEGVMQEMRQRAAIIRDIYNASGGTKGGATMLEEIFGKGPMSRPDRLAATIGKLAKPRPNWQDMTMAQKAIATLEPSGATNWLLRYSLITGFGGMIAGGSPMGISKLMQHPGIAVASLGAFMLTGKFAQMALGSDSRIANAYMDAVLSGKTEKWVDFIQTSSSIAGGTLNGAINLPTPPEEQPQAMVP